MGRIGQVCVASMLLVAACTDSSSGARHTDRSTAHLRPGVEVFMALAATPAEAQAVHTAIRRSHAVRAYRFVSHADIYAEFKSRFADEPDLVATTTADQLPASFRIALSEGVTAAPLVRRWQRLPGVDEVKFHDPNDPTTKIFGHLCRSARNRTRGDAEVFLNVTVTKAQIAALQTDLRRSRLVRTTTFVSQQDAYREFGRLFADQPKLAAATSAEALPASFRVGFRKHVQPKQFVRAFRHRPGVDAVDSSASIRTQCRQLGIGSTLEPGPFHVVPIPVPAP